MHSAFLAVQHKRFSLQTSACPCFLWLQKEDQLPGRTGSLKREASRMHYEAAPPVPTGNFFTPVTSENMVTEED
jgi:hypothetical protein